MIYNPSSEYKVKFYRDVGTNGSPIRGYIESLPDKEQAKIYKYIEVLRLNSGILSEPLSKHIKGELRELRVDFSSSRHRIFYFTFVGKNIILLHAFLNHSQKTPQSEIKKAEERYYKVLKNKYLYE